MKDEQYRKSANRGRAPWFVLILLVLVVVTALVLSHMVLRSAQSSQQVELERILTAEAQKRAVDITAWFGSLESEAHMITNADVFRLFASETDSLSDRDFELFLKMAEEQRILSPDSDETGRVDNDVSEGHVSQLVARLPMMRKILHDFVRQQMFLSAQMFNSAGTCFLSLDTTLPALSAEQERFVRQAWDEGKTQALPVRLVDNVFVLDIVQPVLAPSYLSGSENRVVAVLLLSRDITRIVAEMTSPDWGQTASARLLQVVNGRVEELCLQVQDTDASGRDADGDTEEERESAFIRVLSGWGIDASGNMPLALRTVPAAGGVTDVYSLAMAVRGLPWLVAEELAVEEAQKPWQRYRHMVYFVAALSTLIAALFIGLIWWWLVGRRERAVSAELRALYHTVNEQKQLLAGVNGMLADGIVLEDEKGCIVYSNEAFAAIVEKTPQEVTGSTLADNLGREAAARIRVQVGRVLFSAASVTFGETIVVDGRRRHYQIAVSPFREGGRLSGTVSVYRDVTQLTEARERAENMVQQTISVLVNAIEAIDPYLRGHSAFSGQLAVQLAQALGLSSDHEETLRTAANLSQIGMIQLPHTLLTKAGALTPEERAEMERHITYARASLKGIDFGLPVVQTICQMHEHLDGSGYPEHLRGEDISLDARILAVANTFCALMRPRSYRQARDVREALEILSGQPPRYDPQVVHALCGFLDSPTGERFLRALCDKDM